MTRSRISNQDGFTFVEVLISIAVLSIGLLTLAAMQVLGIRGNVGGEDRTRAAALMSAKLNELRAEPYEMNPQTGQMTVSPDLAPTGGFTDPIKVNENGMTATEFQTIFPDSDPNGEQFRYSMTWSIEDMDDQTKPGAWKRVSVQVSWVNLSVSTANEIERITIDSFPLTPRYP